MRTAPAAAPRALQPLTPRPEVDQLRWLDPDPAVDRECVLYGPAGDRLRLLVDELAAVPDFLAAGLDAPCRLLFSGPSGCGKTLAARWLGNRLGLPVAVTDVASMIGSYMGATGKAIRDALEAAGKVPCILFLDEIDGIGTKRSMANTDAGREMARATSGFLQQLDWLPPGQIVIAATNIPDALDEAVRRRLHEEVAFGPPPRETRLLLVNRWLAKAHVSEVERVRLVDATEGLGGADLRQRAMALGRRVVLERRRATAGQLTFDGARANGASEVRP